VVIFKIYKNNFSKKLNAKPEILEKTIRSLFLKKDMDSIFLFLDTLFNPKFVYEKKSETDTRKINDIELESNYYEALEDICLELIDDCQKEEPKYFNKNLYSYIKNQLKWRIAKKKPKDKYIKMIYKDSNDKDILDYGGNTLIDNNGLYDGLNSICKNRFLEKEAKKKTFKIEDNQFKNTKDSKYYCYLVERFLSFMQYLEIINQFQKCIIYLKVAKGKKLKDIPKILNSTINKVKKQYYKALDKMLIFLSAHNPNDFYLSIYKFTGLAFALSKKDLEELEIKLDTRFKHFSRTTKEFKETGLKKNLISGYYDIFGFALKEYEQSFKYLIMFTTISKMIKNNSKIKNLYQKNEYFLADYILKPIFKTDITKSTTTELVKINRIILKHCSYFASRIVNSLN